MLHSEIVQKATELCILHHAGQIDRDGFPHAFHCFRVASAQDTTLRIAAALVHDLEEDAKHPHIAKQHILEAFYDHMPMICEVADILTKRKGETREEFHARVLTNDDACWIRLADIEDHFSPRRADEKMVKQYGAYVKEYRDICNHLGIRRELTQPKQ